MATGQVKTPTTQSSPAGATVSSQATDVVIDCQIKELYYGTFKAVRDTHIPVKKNAITAFIGPSGCGKSTVLRCLNRMNDLVRGFRFQGHVKYHGKDIYDPSIDPVAVRRYIGMVFQQPNPFATSIFNNVAFGLRINNFKGNKTEKVEKALKQATLWEEVKDKLHNSGLSLSGGQQQRLCIARAVATDPEVLLIDKPCFGARPDCNTQDRRAHERTQNQVHHSDRHSQSATGAAGGRQNRLPVCGYNQRRADRLSRRVRRLETGL